MERPLAGQLGDMIPAMCAWPVDLSLFLFPFLHDGNSNVHHAGLEEGANEIVRVGEPSYAVQCGA